MGRWRGCLYRALSKTGNPTWSTMVKASDALGLQIEVTAQHGREAARHSHQHRATGTSHAAT